MSEVDIGVLIVLLASVARDVIAPCFDEAGVHAATFSHSSQWIFSVIDALGETACTKWILHIFMSGAVRYNTCPLTNKTLAKTVDCEIVIVEVQLRCCENHFFMVVDMHLLALQIAMCRRVARGAIIGTYIISQLHPKSFPMYFASRCVAEPRQRHNHLARSQHTQLPNEPVRIPPCPHWGVKARVEVVNKSSGMDGLANLLCSYWIDFNIWAYIRVCVILEQHGPTIRLGLNNVAFGQQGTATYESNQVGCAVLIEDISLR